jgi:hypothetical protein
MALATITLTSGRDIALTGLEVFSTYGHFLEGYPNVRINDRLLARLSQRKQSAYWTPPVHVIDPPRRRLDSVDDGRRRPFGPAEALPPIYCRAAFRSHPVDEELDQVLYRSYLTVYWFQEDIVEPVPAFVATAVRHLDWRDLAEDDEL